MRRRLLLLGAGSEQIAAIEAARRAGLEVVAADGDAQAAGLRLADVPLVFDIRDAGKVVSAGRERAVHGVFAHAVEIPHVVAEAAAALGLPGIDRAAAVRATDKGLRYEALSAAGVPCPRFFTVSSAAEARDAARELAFPLIVKPSDNAGARGVTRVTSEAELDHALSWAADNGRGGSVLVEEFLEGPEISTEHVILDGRIHTTGFADRNYDRKADFFPYCIEDGHTIPSLLPAALQQDVVRTAEAAVRALGIGWGVAKGDLIVDRGVPKVFEMAARTSGGRFCADMVPLATGVDILETLVRMAVGLPVDPASLEPTRAHGAAQRFFFPDPGRLRGVAGVEEASRHPGAYDVALSPSLVPGAEIRPVTSHADRVGHVIASGESRAEAVARAEAMVRLVRFDVEPAGAPIR